MTVCFKMFETYSKCIETDYDEVPLRYLLAYIMGNFYSSLDGIGIDNDEVTDILVRCYQKNFKYSEGGENLLIIDILNNWENYCAIWDTIRNIKLFWNENYERYLFEKKQNNDM